MLDTNQLLQRIMKALGKTAIHNLEVLNQGGNTSRYATLIVVSEDFYGMSIPARLKTLYKTLDTNDYSLRRDIDFSFILLTPSEKSAWENSSYG